MDLAIDQLDKYTRQKLKLSTTKRREHLEIIAEELLSMPSPDLKKQQDTIVGILLSQAIV